MTDEIEEAGRLCSSDVIYLFESFGPKCIQISGNRSQHCHLNLASTPKAQDYPRLTLTLRPTLLSLPHPSPHRLKPSPSRLNLLRHPPKQRLPLPTLLPGHALPLSTPNLPNPPRALLPRLLKELQVLLEPAPARLRHVDLRHDARDQIRARENRKQPVRQRVEEDGRQQCHGEVRQAPGDHADGCALGARRRGVDFGRDQPGWHEPGYAEGCGGEVEGLFMVLVLVLGV